MPQKSSAAAKVKRTAANRPKRGRIGRPPVADPKRISIGLRTTREIKDKLDEAIELSGRSQAQEIEHRLTESFQSPAEQSGPEMAAFFRALQSRVAAVVAEYQATPSESIKAHFAVKGAIEEFTKHLPFPEDESWPPLDAMITAKDELDEINKRLEKAMKKAFSKDMRKALLKPSKGLGGIVNDSILFGDSNASLVAKLNALVTRLRENDGYEEEALQVERVIPLAKKQIEAQEIFDQRSIELNEAMKKEMDRGARQSRLQMAAMLNYD